MPAGNQKTRRQDKIEPGFRALRSEPGLRKKGEDQAPRRSAMDVQEGRQPLWRRIRTTIGRNDFPL